MNILIHDENASTSNFTNTLWLTYVVSTYLYGAFDSMLLHVTYVFQSESTLYHACFEQGVP